MNDHCEEIFQAVLKLDTSSKTSLFDLAQCFIDGFDPVKLRLLLMSEDTGIVSDGLFVLDEIGELARHYAHELTVLSHSPDEGIRDVARRLAAKYFDP